MTEQQHDDGFKLTNRIRFFGIEDYKKFSKAERLPKPGTKDYKALQQELEEHREELEWECADPDATLNGLYFTKPEIKEDDALASPKNRIKPLYHNNYN